MALCSVAMTRDAAPGGRLPHQLPAGRHGLPRSFVLRNQRERIVASVIEVVSSTGYAGLTVKDVIERAGVSRRTFYEHFSNKEDVFLAAYESVVEQLLGEVRLAYAGGRNWPERVGQGLSTFLEVLAAGPDALGRRARAIEAFCDLVRPEASDAQAVPPLAAEVVVGGIYEIVFAHVSRGEAAALPELWPELLFNMLLPFVGSRKAASHAARARTRRAEPGQAATAGSNSSNS
jgi:AcrR family transcriptional regulator